MGTVVKLDRPLSSNQGGIEGPQSLVGQNVVVLAKNFHLSKPQQDLLSRGLKFIPSFGIGRNQKTQFQSDLHDYHRKLKLAAYFGGSEKQEIPPFMGTSNWIPPLDKIPSEVSDVIREDWDTFNRHFRPIREKDNLSLEEIRALKELKNAKNIVLKPADKGSAVVILSREQYILEAERQLNDTVYYKKLDKPIFMETVPLIHEIIDTLKNKKFINSKQSTYLKGETQPRERRFYILPKIHKDPKSWTIPFEVPPGRPIVSDCGSETYYTAEYIDHHLNPLSNKHPAYVKDTYHFIEIVRNLWIPSKSFLFSMDVSSLYTNIDIPRGICAVKKWLAKYPDPNRPDEELIRLLEINLTKNDFVFNEKYYLQIKGTAMGKKFAPAYANIFMANWEEGVFQKCQRKPFHYLRYLDDIWGIWTGSWAEFQQFLGILNSHDPSIKLTAEVDQREIDFLDTTVYKGPEFGNSHKLDIRVHFKVTDTHALLYATSFHPKHTFRGIVKSQLLRFKRICTRDEDFIRTVRVLFKALTQRGYSRSFLRHCFKTFELRKERGHGNFIPLITTYSSIGNILNKRVKANFERVIGDSGIIPQSRIISAYRRNRNLQDHLIRARLPKLNLEKPLLLEAQFCSLRFIRNSREKTIFQISQRFTPRSTNCVYVIFCVRCGKKYIGETKNSLSTRMVQHRHNIRNQKEVETPLVHHFLIHGLEAVRMAGLQGNVNWSDGERKKRERRWIYWLGTREPFGLNLRFN